MGGGGGGGGGWVGGGERGWGEEWRGGRVISSGVLLSLSFCFFSFSPQVNCLTVTCVLYEKKTTHHKKNNNKRGNLMIIFLDTKLSLRVSVSGENGLGITVHACVSIE